MTHEEHWQSFRDARAHFEKFPTGENALVVRSVYRAWVESDAEVTPEQRDALVSMFDRKVATTLARAAA